MRVNWTQLLLLVLACIAVGQVVLFVGAPVWVAYVFCAALGFFWPVPVFEFGHHRKDDEL